LEELVRGVYDALARGDADAIDELVDPAFEGELAAGMPLGLGGPQHGRDAMRDQGWWALGRAFAVRAEPLEWIPCADGRLLVIGRYIGTGRASGRSFEASFAHLWGAAGGRLVSLRHFTDTAAWSDAA
jgi:2-(1,2-epoxy-1,2-dihydrophenyl)acetyl-CoA isomerase